jgi:hypothetical protein
MCDEDEDDEDPGLWIESFALINLRGVSTNKTIIYFIAMQTYKELITILSIDNISVTLDIFGVLFSKFYSYIYIQILSIFKCLMF